MDRDMINIIHYLYHHGRISDDATRHMLQCYSDTTGPLANSKILEVNANDWKLSQGLWTSFGSLRKICRASRLKTGSSASH